MAENSGQERTEAPTPKRRQDAREKGQVPRSQELTTAAMLLGAALVLNAALPGVASTVAGIFGYAVTAGATTLDAGSAVALLRQVGWKALFAILALASSMAMVALATASVQARGVLASKALEPKWEKLDPIKNIKRLYGVQPWAELLKSLVKLTIVGLAVYKALGAAWPELVSLGQVVTPAVLLDVVRRYALRLLMTAGLAYLGLALADYLYQIWQHEKGLRMSKEEIKQEMKQNEGDPLLKARMRAFGRQLARRQMFQDVPKADVVITNPTHIAIALRYDPDAAPAPIVLAMGQRKVAERIKQIARDAEVPMVENRPLARALLASASVGAMIPAELYVAIAEVLAFVIRQRAGHTEVRA
jgi:flagellar biosynthetic protein FlhB